MQVAGRFCYGVMALSGATFTFWTTLGPALFPAVVPAGGSLLLGLQLACNVLVSENLIPALSIEFAIKSISEALSFLTILIVKVVTNHIIHEILYNMAVIGMVLFDTYLCHCDQGDPSFENIELFFIVSEGVQSLL